MTDITIIGLGPGRAELLTREAWGILSAADEIYVRTTRHPAVIGLPDEIRIRILEPLCDSLERMDNVDDAIAARILNLAKTESGIAYAVPGDPTIGERSVELIREQAVKFGLTVRIVSGLSFVGPTLSALGMDSLPGLYLGDAVDVAELHHPPFCPSTPALLAHLYEVSIALQVKATLMNQYPNDYEVALVHGVGSDDTLVEWSPLCTIDQSDHLAALTILHVPAMSRSHGFAALQEAVAHLRAPYGCPWDLEQTHRSLRPYLLEETYEALEAIDKGDSKALVEELGDLLLQIVLQIQISIDEGRFQMADVISGLNSKLVRRHPHVFGNLLLDGVDEVMRNWEVIKEEDRLEKATSGQVGGILSGVSIDMPSLSQAQSYQVRVARSGLDWSDVSGVLTKVQEKIGGVQQGGGDLEQEEGIGDLLFAVANLSRCLGVDPESALRDANARFRCRFDALESTVRWKGKNLSKTSVRDLELLWEL